MNNNNYHYHDDQDIFDLIKLLWDSKLIILIIMFIGLLISTTFVFTKHNSFVSKVEFKISNTPPSINEDSSKLMLDFQKLFSNEEIFKNWKQTVNKTSLTYNKISETNKHKQQQ